MIPHYAMPGSASLLLTAQSFALTPNTYIASSEVASLRGFRQMSCSVYWTYSSKAIQTTSDVVLPLGQKQLGAHIVVLFG